MGEIMLEKFTRELCDLYVKQQIGLTESLSIIMHKPKLGKIQKTAEFLFQALKEGKNLSNAMQTCPYISFDKTYISFILVAEKTGNLKETIEYLDKKCTREKNNREKLCSTLVYPIFVICLTGFLSYFLITQFGFEKRNVIYFVFICLFIFLLSVFLVINRVFGNCKLYEAFLGTSFLINAGCSISLALDSVIPIVGENSNIGRVFSDAKEKIEYGMDYKSAFCFKGYFEEAFYYADNAGNKNDVFKKIADWMGEKDRKRKEICLMLVEPLFITITGAFLLFLVIYLFLPIMSDLSWI